MLHSAHKYRYFSQNFILLNEFHQNGKLAAENNYRHCWVSKCSTVSLKGLVVSFWDFIVKMKKNAGHVHNACAEPVFDWEEIGVSEWEVAVRGGSSFRRRWENKQFTTLSTGIWNIYPLWPVFQQPVNTWRNFGLLAGECRRGEKA
jgi:hypothetical protein